jgi:hypothetical protein
MQQHYNNDSQAQQYEQFYDQNNPNRRGELLDLEEAMRTALHSRDVLEITSGSRYWTQRATPAVNRITAVEISSSMQHSALPASLLTDSTVLDKGDTYEWSNVPGIFNAGMANFWLSQIPIQHIPSFLNQFHTRIGHGAVVFMSDNVYSQHTGGELIQHPGGQISYKFRTLCSGTKFEMLTDYYLEDQLLLYFGPYTQELRIHVGDSIWWLTYTAHTCHT